MIKIGTHSVIDNGEINYAFLENLGQELGKFNEQKIIVASGSIGLGMEILGYKVRPKTKIELQKCAGVGQVKLMELYARILNKFGFFASQYLVTYHNFLTGSEEDNIRKNIENDLASGIIPVFNYNDKVDSEEITRDNDVLSAHIALMSEASTLLILTSVDGLKDEHEVLIPKIRITEIARYKRFCNGSGINGTGGFATKLKTAELAVPAGIACVIGNIKYKIEDLLEGKAPRTIIY